MSDIADLLKRIGPPDDWMISEDEILEVMLSGPCEHLIAPLERCRECFVAPLTRRQMAALARRLGCSAEDADELAERAVREHRATL